VTAVAVTVDPTADADAPRVAAADVAATGVAAIEDAVAAAAFAAFDTAVAVW